MDFIYSTKSLSFFILIALILTMSGPNSAQAIGQTGKGKVRGTILDTNNEPIIAAQIQLKHENTGRILKAKSKKKGEFLFSFLLPGKYSFTAEKEGYQNQTGEFRLISNTIPKLEIVLIKEETQEQKAEKEAILLFEKGIKLAGENKLDEAIQFFQKATEFKPDFAEAHLNIGTLYYRQQKDDNAEKALLKAYELNPDESKAKQLLADIYYANASKLIQSDRIDEALEILKQAYSIKPEHAYVNYFLGVIFASKGMKEEAIEHFETFLQLEPKSPYVEKVKEVLKDIKEINRFEKI